MTLWAGRTGGRGILAVPRSLRVTPILVIAWLLATPAVRAQDAVSDARQTILKHVDSDGLSTEEVYDWVEFAETVKQKAKGDLSLVSRVKRALTNPWVCFGFLAQFAFGMRFVLQLIASERKKRSYVPVGFWYLSLAGGIMLFVYALQLRDPVFVAGQGLGCFIYIRNLILIYRRRSDLNDRLQERQQRPPAPEPGGLD